MKPDIEQIVADAQRISMMYANAQTRFERQKALAADEALHVKVSQAMAWIDRAAREPTQKAAKKMAVWGRLFALLDSSDDASVLEAVRKLEENIGLK